MAKVTTSQRDVNVTLELTLEEALYVFGALTYSRPQPDNRFGPNGDDPVWNALDTALTDAGIKVSTNYADRS